MRVKTSATARPAPPAPNTERTAALRTHDPLDKRLRARLRHQQDPNCGICHGRLGPIDYTAPAGHPLSFEADHITPLARGGEKSWDNLQAAHRTCNRAKSDLLPGEPTTTTPRTRTRTRITTTNPVTPRSSCPPGPCTTCRGTHNPRPGITFITARQWKP